MTEIITSILPYAAGLVAIIGGIFGIFFAGKRSGKSEERNQQVKDRLEATQKAKDIQHETEAKSDSDLLNAFDELHNNRR
ncbi:MAG: hypothetical protein CML17_02235 [Pusillimonas sp.]|jgi:hypothetical protein|nr:hypothetical protein [Pusillimonas sp.]